MGQLQWVRRLAAPVLVILLGIAPGLCARPLHAQDPMGRSQPTAPRISVVVQLAAPSVVDVYVAQQAAADVPATGLAEVTQTHLAVVEQAQQAFLAHLSAYDAQLIFRVQRVYNGVAVRLPAAALADLTALPGVHSIHPLIPKLPSNTRAIPRLGAPHAWETPPGLTGAGVTIAVIDTGLDYLHTAFGGPGSGYAANDPTRSGDVPNFPGEKVIGGYDFAGDAYNADAAHPTYQPIPSPDPDPMDCYSFGHGTHVASSAAGYGVNAQGDTYRGPYPPAADAALRIGPGVAPDAQIYALKVFGCTGSSELVDQAVEWAIDPNGDGDFADRVDVINLSLGSPFGASDDISALAAANAAKTGAIVVASAGNSGDLFYAVSSPGAADAVLAVAASSLPPAEQPETIMAFSARGPRRVPKGSNLQGHGAIKPDLAAPGDAIVAARAGSGSGSASSSGTSMAAGLTSGTMALLRQARPSTPTSGPGWSAAELKTLAMNTALPLADPEGHAYGPTRAGAGRIDLGRALAGQVIAYDAAAPERVGIHFGAPEVLDHYQAAAAIHIANKGSTPITFTVGYSAAATLPGATLQVEAGRVLTVPAGGLATTALTLSVDAAALRHLPDPTLTHSAIVPRSWLAEIGGYVTLTPPTNPAGSQPMLRVPVYAAPRPVAQLQMTPAGLDFGASISATTRLTYTGVGLAMDISTGAPPTQPVTLGAVVTLHRRSPPIHTVPDGASNPDRYGHADLAAVGLARLPATSELPGMQPEMIYVALATYAPWSTPHEVRFNVYFDTDLDGRADWLLVNHDQVAWQGVGRGGSDAFVAALTDLAAHQVTLQPALNGYSAAHFDTRLFNSRVMLLPVRVQDLHLPPGKRRFAYGVESYSEDISNARALGLAVDRTSWIRVDLDAPGLAVESADARLPLTAIQPGDQVQVHFDSAGPKGDRGLLVIHFYNAVDRQVEMIPARYSRRYHLPWTPVP